MSFELVCPTCKRPLNEHGFCSDPECQIDVTTTCKCLDKYRNFSIKKAYKQKTTRSALR